MTGCDFLDEAQTTAVMTQEDESIVSEADKISNRRYLRPREIVAFLLTTFGQKNLNQYASAYRQFFMISFLGLSGAAYGLIVFIESIYDAADDSISGVIIDRTRTRWGRLRPYLLLPTPFWAIASVMLFSAPVFLETNASRVIWAIVGIFVFNLGMSYFNAWNILLYNITPNIRERDSLIGTSKFFELFGTYLTSMVPFFVDYLPGISKGKIGMQSVYTYFAVVMAVIAGATAIYGFKALRERVPLANKDDMKQISIWQSFKNAFKNKPLFILLISSFFAGFKSVGATNESFFWLHNTGKLSNAMLCSLFTGIPAYFMTPLAPKIARKIGARNAAALGGIFAGVFYFILFLVNPYKNIDNKVVALVVTTILLTLAGFPNGVLNVCGAILQGDVYDYSEWKTGVRNEALVATVSNYFQKLSNSVMGLLGGAVITWIGYTAQKDELGNVIRATEPNVLFGFFFLFSVVPAIARFLYGVTLLFFPIHGKFKEQMNEELAVRRLEKIKANEADSALPADAEGTDAADE